MKNDIMAVFKQPSSDRRLAWRWIGGVAFSFLFAALGFAFASIPGLEHLGPLACAIVLAVMYRHFFGYPEALRSGIQFAAKHLLRMAIILFGLKLNMAVVIHQGLGLLLRDAAVIVFSIWMMMALGKIVKANASLSLLLGIGTGVCGAAAIAAVAPIIEAKEEDTAISVGIIALVGTVFSLAYTFIQPFLPVSHKHYGIWCGISLHEMAHVALAGAAAGQDALAFALLAKLGRVLLLLPLSLLCMYWMKRKKKNADMKEKKIEFPWFLLGFMLLSLFGSVVSIPKPLLNSLSSLTSFMLTAAMVGLGLNVSLRDLRTKALRPLVAICITSILLSFLSFFVV
ncbi:putative integral membrane protein (TIGR00698 family) [Anoxybacillus rupiensis]|nr:putative integral membrane protein (TIGR00698 family) [Anoxybacillus rupiensis]